MAWYNGPLKSEPCTCTHRSVHVHANARFFAARVQNRLTRAIKIREDVMLAKLPRVRLVTPCATLKTPDREYPSWLEIHQENGRPVAQMVGRWGNA